MRKIVCFLTVVFAGCTSTSEVVPMGKDSYMISGQSRGGAFMSGKSLVEAGKAANSFCEQKGLVMMPRSANTDGSATWTAETSALVFTCLRADDPEYKRPDIKATSPSAVQH